MSALFQAGDVTLASGAKSSWKIECDALTDDDWAGLATMLAGFVGGPFDGVVGVPRGGVLLAGALESCVDLRPGYPFLVVDDVWTTGESMERFIADFFRGWSFEPKLVRAVVFARKPPPPNVTALFTMPGVGRKP